MAVLQRLLSFGRASSRHADTSLLVWLAPVHCPFTSAAHSLVAAMTLISRALHAGEKSAMCSLIHAATRPSPGSTSVQKALISTAQGRGRDCARAVVPAANSSAMASSRICFLGIVHSPSNPIGPKGSRNHSGIHCPIATLEAHPIMHKTPGPAQEGVRGMGAFWPMSSGRWTKNSLAVNWRGALSRCLAFSGNLDECSA
jgi:hypothetical protein